MGGFVWRRRGKGRRAAKFAGKMDGVRDFMDLVMAKAMKRCEGTMEGDDGIED